MKTTSYMIASLGLALGLGLLFGLAACSNAGERLDRNYDTDYSAYGGDEYGGSTDKAAPSVSACSVGKSGVGIAPIDTVFCTCTQIVKPACADAECGDCDPPEIRTCASPSFLTIGLPLIPTFYCLAGDWAKCDTLCASACETGCIVTE